MSIWCSWSHIGTEDFDGYEISPGIVQVDIGAGKPTGRKVVHSAERGDVRAYADGWSNHYPTDRFDDPVATVMVNSIPAWCVPGHREDHGEFEAIGPWLRIDVDSEGALSWWTKDGVKPTPAPAHASVVLDEEAVRSLRDDLDEWLAKPKVQPAEETE